MHTNKAITRSHIRSRHRLHWRSGMRLLMQITILALVGTSLAIPIKASASAGRVFYDGFESGSFAAGWGEDDGSGPGIISQAGNKGHDNFLPPVAGQRQMECWYLSNDDHYCNYIPIDTLYKNEIFIRLWMRADKDVQSNEGSMAHLLRFFAGGGIQTDISTDMVTDGAGGAQMITGGEWNGENPAGSTQYFDYIPGLGDHKWHKYELYLDNATHVYKMWQDDVLVISISDPMINFHFANFFPVSNWGTPSPTDNNTHFYFDEVEVFSDLGTGASGSMANGDVTQGSSTAPLAPPANLRVQ